MIELYSGHKAQVIRLRDHRAAASRQSELRREWSRIFARGMLASIEMGKLPPEGRPQTDLSQLVSIAVVRLPEASVVVSYRLVPQSGCT
jgi:hypothetical protein